MSQKEHKQTKASNNKLNDKDILNSNNTNFNRQQNSAKVKIMNKYNISEDSAEEILNIVAKRTQNKNKNNININESNATPNTEDMINKKNKPNLEKSNINDVNKFKNQINQNNNNSTKHSSDNPKKQKSQDVDALISNIVPNYNPEVSIELNHVSLTFEVVNEKVDTIKENFIRFLQRNKTKKVKIHALKDMSFKIYKGEKVGIIGYNGAGKSTLLNVISGIYPSDEGYVKTNGTISPLLSLGAGFDHNYSGRRNIYLNGAVLGYDKEFLESKVEEIIEFSELGDFIDIPIKNYSSGMLAKLGFSIATAVDPDILIIDEVLGVGDVNFQKKCKNKIRSLMDGGTTVLFVSHSIPQVRELCDKAIWIDNGELREIGEINKVCDHYLKDAEKASKNQTFNIQFK